MEYDRLSLLLPPFSSAGGHAWTAAVPQRFPIGDGAGGAFASCLQLYEDGIPLRASGSLHADIREVGAGRFSHWIDRIYFSTSDNSDPSRNGRSYSVACSSELRAKIIAEAAEHGFFNAVTWLGHLGGGGYDLVGKTVCEIGPGDTLAATLVLAGLGADCWVIDRIGKTWDAVMHPALIDEICRQAPARLARPFYPERLARCVELRDFAPAIRVFDKNLETADNALRATFDLTVSASVLEHVADASEAMRALYAITKTGGLGVHCVDFRDHRNMDRPLEFLLLSDAEYDALSDAPGHYRYVTGNRIRPRILEETLLQSGFFACSFRGFSETAPIYLADISKRLHDSGISFDAADLAYLNGVFRLSKAA